MITPSRRSPQAGDVNVNAIAPGVSAALLATVDRPRGRDPRAVWLQLFRHPDPRRANADMQVFANELVTRMGEFVHTGTGDARIAAE